MLKLLLAISFVFSGTLGAGDDDMCIRKAPNSGCTKVSLDRIKTWNTTGGVFDIYPGNSGRKVEVYCDLLTDGGGWTVFQRRMDGSLNFTRSWAEYVAGFGNPAGEFWMGLEKLHRLTRLDEVELRVDLVDWDGNRAYAFYASFSIGDAFMFYSLNVGDYSGNAGDSLSYHTNMTFSTFDFDTDQSEENCALTHQGGWWFHSCDYSNLNGLYYIGGDYKGEHDDGIEWFDWKKDGMYSMAFTEMKFRPKI